MASIHQVIPEPQTQFGSVEIPKNTNAPFEDLSAAESVRNKVDDVLSVAPHYDPELLKRISDAYDALKKILVRKKLSAEEIGMAQESMKLMGSYEIALEAFGMEGLRRYFQLLSGADMEYPYFFTYPILDEDMEPTWLFDHYHDDPSYQDNIVLEYIDEQIETVAVNLLLSRLKGNPEFYRKVAEDEKLKDGAGKPHISAFTQSIFDYYRLRVLEAGNPPDPKKSESNRPLQKTSFAFSYLFYFKDRVKKLNRYFDLMDSGKVIVAAKVRKEIKKDDCRYYEKLERL